MEPVTPRWEWRTFGAAVDAAAARLPGSPGPVRHSDETYLVSRHSDANTKIRDALIDVKLRHRADDRGLELWSPVLKSGFPLAADVVAQLYMFWLIACPDVLPPCASPDDLVRLAGRLAPDLAVVQVAKARTGLVVDGCQVEIADLRFGATPLRTCAVEAADPDRVWATVCRLGLEHHPNTNYVSALKQYLLQERSG